MGDEPRAAEGRCDPAVAALVIAALRARAGEIRTTELARAERRLRGLTSTEREIVDTVTKSLVCALLRDPVRRLSTAGAELLNHCEAITHLFALDIDDEATRSRR
jgi:glutamyl-tRNA reductase